MLSMKKILFVATLFLAAAVLGVTFFAGREQSSPRAATETPLTISPSPDLHGFLADKVADLANSFESPAEEPLPVKTGKEETADASGTAPIRRLPDREIIFRDEKNAPEKLAAREAEYKAKFANPFVAGARGFIDDVIMPHGTRRRVAQSLRWLRSKKIQAPWRKHGNIPL